MSQLGFSQLYIFQFHRYKRMLSAVWCPSCSGLPVVTWPLKCWLQGTKMSFTWFQDELSSWSVNCYLVTSSLRGISSWQKNIFIRYCWTFLALRYVQEMVPNLFSVWLSPFLVSDSSSYLKPTFYVPLHHNTRCIYSFLSTPPPPFLFSPKSKTWKKRKFWDSKFSKKSREVPEKNCPT